jgi:hypothetical protein
VTPVWQLVDRRERPDVVDGTGQFSLSQVECVECGRPNLIDLGLLIIDPGGAFPLLLAVPWEELQSGEPPSAPALIELAWNRLGPTSIDIPGPALYVPRFLLPVVLGRKTTDDMANPDRAIAEVGAVYSQPIPEISTSSFFGPHTTSTGPSE